MKNRLKNEVKKDCAFERMICRFNNYQHKATLKLPERAILRLLQVQFEGSEHVVGWAYERQQGRSVGITLGHFHHNFAREDFRRLLVNSILWAAGREVPREGANVTLRPEDLRLEPPSKRADS